MKIKTITVVTNQGVRVYEDSRNTAIIESSYSVCGDPYPCYDVVTNNKKVAEIRCIHNITIDFKDD